MNINASNVPALQRPAHLTSLATAGILVTVEMSAWTGNKQDKAISDEVATAKKATTEAGRYVQHLLAGDPVHKKLINYRQTVYNWLRRMTFPWAGDQHYLPSVRIPQFMTEFRVHETEYKRLLDEFLAVYPSLVSNAAFTRGEMFHKEDYPTVEQIRTKFRMNLYTAEVPMNDFRCQVANDLADDLFNTYSRQTEALVDRMTAIQAQQLLEVMETLSRNCEMETVIDENGNTKVKRKKLYESTVRKALDLCDTFQSFNLTENPHIEQARSALQALLTKMPYETLKGSDAARDLAKREVDDILDKFRPRVPKYVEDEE